MKSLVQARAAPLLQLALRRVAVFRALQLGDMLCAVPALRALRRALPAARIVLIGLPWAADFARRFRRYLDGFVAFPGFPGFPERVPDLHAWPGFLATVQDEAFDLVIQLHGDGSRSNDLCALFAARRLAGFCPRSQAASPFLLPSPDTGHEIHRLLKLMRFLGAAEAEDRLEFPLAAEDRAHWRPYPAVERLLSENYVCLHAGARAAGKRWPPENFAAAGDALHAEYGLRIVLTGSEQEQPLTRAVAGAMRAPAVDAAAPIPVGGLAALIARARLLISNDTGIAHLAAALQVPSVVVFRNTDAQRWAPLDTGLHRAVWDPEGRRLNEVLREARTLLAAHHRIFQKRPAPFPSPAPPRCRK